MTDHGRPLARARSDSGVPAILDRARSLVTPALRAAVDGLEDEHMRLIAGYQLGWCDARGVPTEGGGKAIRPALAVLSAEAVGALPALGVPGAIAVELVHNFSLLHDDVMDRDVQRRHRASGWVAFGEGQALLAGNAMLIAAVQVLEQDGPAGQRCLRYLLDATQQLISGQSQDLDLEGRASVTLADVVRMEAGKTAALLSCAASIGAVAAGASAEVVAGLAGFGHEVGVAFQLVDDILGVVGDSTATGKSSSSDVRAGKRSAPIVASLTSDSDAGRRLAELLCQGPPQTDQDVALATELVEAAGGLDWTAREADRHLAGGLEQLRGLGLPNQAAVAELGDVARYIVARDH